MKFMGEKKLTRSSDSRVLVLGASGMLGNAVLRLFAGSEGFDARGTVRSSASARLLPQELRGRLEAGVDVENPDSLAGVLARVRPQVVINCVGVVKQLAEADDPLAAIPINALLPHRWRACAPWRARLVHVSTDCVFSGTRGLYTEADFPDANDLYGRSKYLGEVDYPTPSPCAPPSSATSWTARTAWSAGSSRSRGPSGASAARCSPACPPSSSRA
jgi:dTDP-4-dehydrorhamnose reductase